MRILVDEYFFPWEDAWSIVRRVCSYTNHTVMPEALETWNEDLFRLKLPRIYAIIKEINERFCREAWQVYPGNWQRIGKMSVISYGQVHMANLAVIGSHSVNGVSKLHSQILRESVFKDFYRMYQRHRAPALAVLLQPGAGGTAGRMHRHRLPAPSGTACGLCQVCG